MILSYRNQDLRFLSQPVREDIAIKANRLREVEYWPAFILDMKHVDRQTYTIFIESPPVPEAEPPQEKVSMTVFTHRQAITPIDSRKFYVKGVLKQATVIHDHNVGTLGDLLKLSFEGRHSGSCAFYALSGEGGDTHLVFVRKETDKGVLLEKSEPAWFSHRTKWDALRSDWKQFDDPMRLADLMGALLYLATVSQDEKEFGSNEINNALSNLRTSEQVKKFASHENAWVKNMLI